jgi:invasion protein IalB
MNVSKLALAFAASAAFVSAAPVFAAMPAAQNAAQTTVQQAQAWTPSSNAANTKLTRAEVRQQLVEAQHDGQLAALRDVYRGS